MCSQLPLCRGRLWLGTALLATILSVGCAGGDGTPAEGATDRPRAGRFLTLGDIEADEPARRIRRIQPLADYLASNLHELGYGAGRVRIARGINEMATMMANGEVDLLLDSPYPILSVQALAPIEVLLLRHAQAVPEYWSVFLASDTSGLEDLRSLSGQVILLEGANSTTGYFLPILHLTASGHRVRQVANPQTNVDSDTVGYYFSGDEENTVEMLITGAGRCGAISSLDYRSLPAETKARLVVLDRTASVPRQLVAVADRLGPELSARIRELLLAIDDEDRSRLEAEDPGRAWTWRFSVLSSDYVAALGRLREAIRAGESRAGAQ